MVNNTIYHLLVLAWGLRHFWKRRNIRKGCVRIEYWGTSAYFVSGFEENSMQNKSVCFLIVFIKGILKAFFSLISRLLNLFDLPNYGSKSRKRYSLRLLSECLGRSTLSLSEVKSPHPPSLTFRFPLRFP